ncbi:MAG: ATPase [Methanobrevibacter sp.]|uniref:ATPase n=1 Tax=Methanobrevibacter sp. TaxID=66852 RepID=UPI0025F4C0CC|nr:ATPase [Methanobrevibacter sp.]MBE6508583.1 ATPase [Methanobrevibacter sp.]
MNGITILIWITIAIIGIISIILVKMHYGDEELESGEKSIIPSAKSLSGILESRKEKVNSQSKFMNSFSQQKTNKSLYGNRTSVSKDDDAYIVPEVNDNSAKNIEYESENQVLINYGNEVKKFQEPIKQNQMDIMNQNNKEEKTELKDLFTIDELIKESKRKDSEREKESQNISKDDDLTEIKESIKQRKEGTAIQEPLIEEIINESDTIEELLNETANISEEVTEEIEAEAENAYATQKEIEETITSASQESKEEIESISEETNITDVLLDSAEEEVDVPNEEIKEPTLKSPSKIKDDFGAPIENTNLFESDEYKMDLDYRKDIDKITNKIRSSKIFQEVKDKLTQEPEARVEEEYGAVEETYIRNVNEYDEFEPIINETHIDYVEPEEEYPEIISDDEKLRQENTRKVFNMAKNSAPEVEKTQSRISPIKNKPSKDNIKLTLNNNEVVLKKGDEIIFTHEGETYSSQVYAINGDDISVRYRRKNITIKPKDVKKIY